MYFCVFYDFFIFYWNFFFTSKERALLAQQLDNVDRFASLLIRIQVLMACINRRSLIILYVLFCLFWQQCLCCCRLMFCRRARRVIKPSNMHILIVQNRKKINTYSVHTSLVRNMCIAVRKAVISCGFNYVLEPE